MQFGVRPLHLVAMSLFLGGVSALLACGGGGDGGGQEPADGLEAARVVIDAQPRTIDSGDRMRVTVTLETIDADGVLLKVRFPPELDYVEGTSILTVLGENVEAEPGIDVTTGNTNEEQSYVVYDFPNAAFGQETSAQLTLLLQGVRAKDSAGSVAVDVDFNDPGKTIDEKFSNLSPQFNPDDSVEIRVKDESGLITPSPTPTPTNTPTPRPTATAAPTRTPRPTATPAA